MPETVAVLGAGNMGTALAQVIASNGHQVRLWSIETDVLEEIRGQHRNTKYLDGIELRGHVQAVWDLDETINGASLVILSVPSQVVASIGRDMAPHLARRQVVLNVGKGLDAPTKRCLSEVLVDALGSGFQPTTGSMGGPAIAIEMAQGKPMAVIIGIPTESSQQLIQRILQNENLKVDATDDVRGLELCSALKNVYAIALGICDGMRLGANTKAFVGTVALDEMARISVALGGQPETVYGLAGLGDLLTTGWSQHSRNRTLGEKLGANTDWEAFMAEKTVEGVVACRAIEELTRDTEAPLPLLDTIHGVFFDGQHAPDALPTFLRDFSY